MNTIMLGLYNRVFRFGFWLTFTDDYAYGRAEHPGLRHKVGCWLQRWASAHGFALLRELEAKAQR